MSHPNKIRSYASETYTVEKCKRAGIPAQRAWSSDGRAMGLSSKDDGLLAGRRWQDKRVKHSSAWFRSLTEYFDYGIELVTVYVDRCKGHPRQVYVIQPLEKWIEDQKMIAPEMTADIFDMDADIREFGVEA